MVKCFFLGFVISKKKIHNFPSRKEKRSEMVHICSSMIILSSKGRTISVVRPLSIFFLFSPVSSGKSLKPSHHKDTNKSNHIKHLTTVANPLSRKA